MSFCLRHLSPSTTGHETTANTLSFAIHQLAEYPDIQRKARQQVIEVLGDERQNVLPKAEQLKQLKYIDMILIGVWCFEEEDAHNNINIDSLLGVIELTVDGTCRTPFKQTSIARNVRWKSLYPKGAAVSVDLTIIHPHLDVWERPKDFIPERFAEGAEAEHQKGLAWLPFSNGRSSVYRHEI